jgi:hypothetical protein
MLYDTMSPGFLPALTVLAVVAALFTLAGVREATLGEKTLPVAFAVCLCLGRQGP